MKVFTPSEASTAATSWANSSEEEACRSAHDDDGDGDGRGAAPPKDALVFVAVDAVLGVFPI